VDKGASVGIELVRIRSQSPRISQHSRHLCQEADERPDAGTQ
jgi:hypothetical protein